MAHVYIGSGMLPYMAYLSIFAAATIKISGIESSRPH